MSQPQTQHKSSMLNGLSRRRGDRDISNRPESYRSENKYRPFRPAPSNNLGTESFGHTQVYHSKSDSNAGQNMTATSKPAEDELETLSHEESRNGDPKALLCLTACLIGHPVEVQLKNGSVYSGIFHTANAEKDYGIVLRMAQLIHHGSTQGETNDNAKELAKRPVKTFIVYAHDLVQIIAKDVPLQGERLQNGRSRENRSEIVTDSFLSQGRHGELERELKPWTPDKDDPNELGLESTFQNTWNRNWDQFEINKSLFGVESTFDEDLYTTKLERGPQMREREREAWRIAREIEGQGTRNLHLAEERGVTLIKEFEVMDEESRYSSVLRTSEDIGDDNDDGSMDFHNDATFGNATNESGVVVMGYNGSEPSANDIDVAEGVRNRALSDINELKNRYVKVEPSHSAQEPTTASMDSQLAGSDDSNTTWKDRVLQTVGDRSKRAVKVGGLASPLVSPRLGDTTSIQALDLDPGFPQVTEDVYREFNEFKLQENAKRGRKQREDQVNELKSFSESLRDLTSVRQHTTASVSTRKMASSFAPPASALPIPASITSSVGGSDSTTSATTQTHLTAPDSDFEPRTVSDETNSHSGPQIETASTSGTHSLPQITEAFISSLNSSSPTPMPSSPSSSSGVSDFSKKSSLNPNAKEFKLNPNAKSFTPSFTPLRPPSPVVPGPVYVPGIMAPIPPIQTVPVGVNPLLHPGGQPGARYTPYSPGATSYIASPTSYTPVSGAPVPPLVNGQTSMKVLPQLQHPVSQPMRYTSQAQPVQPTSTYVHPTTQMYSQQVMFCPPGQVAYFHPYLQGPMPPPPPQPLQTGQQSQPRHRGVQQAMTLCVPPPLPFIPGQHQQTFATPQINNPSAPAPTAPAPAPAPAMALPPPISPMQLPQSVVSSSGVSHEGQRR